MSNDKLTKLERKAMERVGRQVWWQQLGDEFKDHPFCFHVLDQSQEKGLGAVIVHLLKLAYHQDDDTKAFCVAVDSEDVRMLRDLLDRAISKEDRIKKTMKTSGIQFVGSEQEAN